MMTSYYLLNPSIWYADMADLDREAFSELVALARRISLESQETTVHPVYAMRCVLSDIAENGFGIDLRDIPENVLDDCGNVGYIASEINALLAWGARREVENLHDLIELADRHDLWDSFTMYGRKIGLYDTATNVAELERWCSGDYRRIKN